MRYILGIDTSNYTTSAAVIDKKYNIIEDRRTSITVKDGMKGIRQSEALFQHMEVLPEMVEELLLKYASELDAVCVSSKPRPVKGSYMPVFKAGLNAAKLISDSIGIPLLETSHQEGHIEAGKYPETGQYTPDSISNEDLAVFHLSGGTTEILLNNGIIGGSKDISFGQLLDRMGGYAGFPFPAGAKMDEIACEALDHIGSYEILKKDTLNRFKYISKNNLYINLSGLDTQIKRIIEAEEENIEINEVIVSVFYLISHCLKTLTKDIKKQYNVKSVLYVGGVSSSKFIRDYLLNRPDGDDLNILFARPELSVDNAVGVALIGGNKQWR